MTRFRLIGEVNSTGRVVYGFHWQRPRSGGYTLTVTTNGITLGATDAGILVDTNDGHTAMWR